MILTFDDRVIADLAFAGELSGDQLMQLCQLAVEFTESGGESAAMTAAAKTLGVRKSILGNGMAALSNVLMEAAKNRLSQDKFLLSIADFAMPDGHKATIAEFYVAHKKAIRESLAHMKMTLPSYQNLDWRLDVEVASRSLHTQVTPSFVLRLDTAAPDVTSQYMQCDYANLKRLVEALETAEAELSNSHSKRVVKFIR